MYVIHIGLIFKKYYTNVLTDNGEKHPACMLMTGHLDCLNRASRMREPGYHR